MLNKRLAFNNKAIDAMLNGGIEHRSLTNLYGPPGSGKTNLAIIAAVSAVLNGKKVVYIDTEGGFSVERLSQITNEFQKVMDNTILIEPKTFEDQDKAIKNMHDNFNPDTGLIILDSLVNLYRLELDEKNFQRTNKKLSNQLSLLSKLSREKDIPVLITNHMYSDNNGTHPVSRDITRYWSKCLVELVKLDKGRRIAILKKHRSLPEGSESHFRIIQEGIESSEKKFKLF